MSQLHTVGSHRTTVFTEDGETKVVYHSTKVVGFDRDTITLNSGGYRSATTKARMNQASNQFGLGFQVYQENWDWFVSFNGETLDFEDGITLDR